MVNALLLGYPDQSCGAAFSQALTYLRRREFIQHEQIEAFKILIRSGDNAAKKKTAKEVFCAYYLQAQGQMLRRVFLKAFLVTTPMPPLFLEAIKKKLIGRLDSSFAGGCIKKQNDTVFFGIKTM